MRPDTPTLKPIPKLKRKPAPRPPPDKRKGKAYADRPVSVSAKTANQHISSPKQELFLDNYLVPASPTFGNAYQSAMSAGYSDAYAREITAPSHIQGWLTENPRLRNLQGKHINLLIEEIATDRGEKTTDRLKALELSAKLKGLLIERKLERTEVITISLGTLKNAYTEPQTGIRVDP